MAREKLEEPHPVDRHVGRRVQEKRLGLGLTQSALARALGVSFQQVQKYEQGRNRVATSKLVRMADAMKCDASELLGEEGDGAPGAGRLIRAWSRLDLEQREAVTRLVEAFGR